MMSMYVAVNENGYRIGETHHRAKYPDTLVDLIRAYHEDRGLSYAQIAIRLRGMKLKVCVPVRTIAKICRYEIRAQTPERHKRVQ